MEFLQRHQLNFMLFLQGICFIISLSVLLSKNLSRQRKISILFIEISALLLLTFDRFAYIYRGNVSNLGWWMVRVSNFFVFFFSLLILHAFNLYLSDLLTHECKVKKLPWRLKLVSMLFLIGVCLLILSQFTGLYYTFDSENRYVRSGGMLICFVIPLIILCLQLSCIIQFYKKIPSLLRLPLLLFTILPLAATVAQLLLYGLSLTNISIVGMSVVIYAFTIYETNEAVERAHKLELKLLEEYKQELEITVEERTHDLKLANEKVEHLLLNILPEDVARELSEHPNKTISKKYPNSTVLFTDIVGFTKLSSSMTAEDTVVMLNKLTSLFDDRAKKEGVEKIKTIGDAYMAATGLTEDDDNDGAEKMIHFALGLLEDVKKFNKLFPVKVEIRVGINTGELVAGVIGKTKFIYDVWGDTVNVASRMESTGEPMKIHVSEKTYSQTKNIFEYKNSIKVDVKGKGQMDAYFL